MNDCKWQANDSSEKCKTVRQINKAEKVQVRDLLYYPRGLRNFSTESRMAEQEVHESSTEYGEMKEAILFNGKESGPSTKLVKQSTSTIKKDRYEHKSPDNPISSGFKTNHQRTCSLAMSTSSNFSMTNSIDFENPLPPVIIPSVYKKNETRYESCSSLRSSILHTSWNSSFMSSVCSIPEILSSISLKPDEFHSPIGSPIMSYPISQSTSPYLPDGPTKTEKGLPPRTSHHTQASSTTLPFLEAIGSLSEYVQADDGNHIKLKRANRSVRTVSTDDVIDPVDVKMENSKTVLPSLITHLSAQDSETTTQSETDNIPKNNSDFVKSGVLTGRMISLKNKLPSMGKTIGWDKDPVTVNDETTNFSSSYMNSKENISLKDAKADPKIAEKIYVPVDRKHVHASDFIPDMNSRGPLRRATMIFYDSENFGQQKSRDSGFSLTDLICRAKSLGDMMEQGISPHTSPMCDDKNGVFPSNKIGSYFYLATFFKFTFVSLFRIFELTRIRLFQ